MSISLPSPRAMVPFVSVHNMMRLIHAIGINEMIIGLAAYIEEDFNRWPLFDKTPRVAAHARDGVIELMPISDGHQYGFKYVDGHPANMARGLQTVTAFGVLANLSNGYPVLMSEMTLLTALRTAATSALAARYLAPKSARIMAMIGAGAQCEFQAIAFHEMLGITRIRLFDIDPLATQKTAQHLDKLGFNIVISASPEQAVTGADIITTCTADKQNATVLTDNMVGAGVHINAIGGDCPGKTELHRDILLRSDVFVEYLPQTRIEGEIQSLAQDHPATELWQVIRGDAAGRCSVDQITLFDSVGFAIEDFSALRYVYHQIQKTGHYQKLDLLADPDDPRDLYGMLQRSKEDGRCKT